METPLFLTQKINVTPLSESLNIFDFQLQIHLANCDDLYVALCDCERAHTHEKIKCPITNKKRCAQCGSVATVEIPNAIFAFHPDITETSLRQCCYHFHEPPCLKCIECLSKRECRVKEKIKCNYTSLVVCPGNINNHETPRLTKFIVSNNILKYYKYKSKNLGFYVCEKHAHFHAAKPTDSIYFRRFVESKKCFVQTEKCCDNSIFVTDLDYSFVLSCVTDIGANKKMNKKLKIEMLQNKYLKIVSKIIYNPQIWRDQSKNHFISILRSILLNDGHLEERYASFEYSKFTITNLKSFKSGKLSFVRTSVTGFETLGIYQTATISCVLNKTIVLIPQKLYNLIIKDYYTKYVVIKRDPSIQQTCAYVCKIKPNPDAKSEVIVIPDAIAKPLNQDQDGDKNGIYLLPLTRGEWYKKNNVTFKLAKLEMKEACGKKLTTIGLPRYSFSEHNILLMMQLQEHLSKKFKYFKHSYSRGIKFMQDCGCGYYADEFDEFCDYLIELNKKSNNKIITIYDICDQTPHLKSIVSSGAKGSEMSLKVLFEELRTVKNLKERLPDMITQLNLYTKSSKKLSLTGRKHFIAEFASQDMNTFLGRVYLNKIHLADYTRSSFAYPFSYNEASLTCFVEELIDNYEKETPVEIRRERPSIKKISDIRIKRSMYLNSLLKEL